MPYTHEQWQIEQLEHLFDLFLSPVKEAVYIRSRGGSKTHDTMEWCLYMIYLGFEVIYFTANASQLERPKIYMKDLIGRSFLKWCITDKNNLQKEKVEFDGSGRLSLVNLTENKAISPRADVIVFDEERKADPDAYNNTHGIFADTNLGFILHISTPEKASIFEDNVDDLRRQEILDGNVYVLERQIYDISFLWDKRREHYLRLKRRLPQWFWEQEFECKFTHAMGAVFQNVEYDVYQEVNNEWILKHDIILSPITMSGIDWNPVSGHWCVGGCWLENMRGFLVTHAIPIAVGYSHKLKEEAYLTIKKYAVHKKRLCIESGGINEEYVDWFKEWFGKDRAKRDVHVLYEDWDSAGINKINSVLSLLDKTIYVDRIRFPELAKQIENCRWDSDSDVPRLDKDPVDSPHALDAFLHAVNKRLLKDQGLRRFDWYGST